MTVKILSYWEPASGMAEIEHFGDSYLKGREVNSQSVFLLRYKMKAQSSIPEV